MRAARSLAEATPLRPAPSGARRPPARRAVPNALLPDREQPLLPREAEVERLILRGLATKEIARALGITWRTATTHAGAIYRKRGVHSRAELIAQYYERSAAGVSLDGAAVPLRDQPCIVVIDGALVSGTCTGTFTPSAQP